MNQKVTEEFSQSDQPKFRINAQVVQILALIVLALALPVTCLIMGFLEIRKNQSAAQAPSIEAPEVPGIRQSLEAVAEARMPVSSIEIGPRAFAFLILSQAASEKLQATLQNLVTRCSGVSLQSDAVDNNSVRLLIQIPSDSVEKFEEELKSMKPSAQPSTQIEIPSKVSVYEIQLRMQ
jgi:hypothetical protein